MSCDVTICVLALDLLVPKLVRLVVGEVVITRTAIKTGEVDAVATFTGVS